MTSNYGPTTYTASLNGEFWDKSFIKFNSIQLGGQIDFSMSDKPNKNWAANRDSVPYSLSSSYQFKN